MRNKLFLFVFLFAVLAIVDSHAFERKKNTISTVNGVCKSETFPKLNNLNSTIAGGKRSLYRMPLMKMKAFKVSIEQLTDTVVWYRKHFRIPASGKKQKVFIEFEGVRQAGDFYLNGQYLGKTRKRSNGGRLRPDTLY